MKGKWAIMLLVLMVWTAIVAVYAVHADSPTGNVGNQVDLKEGITETTKTAVNVTSSKGQIAFTDKTTGISVTTSTLIDDRVFIPAKTTIDKTVTWDNAITNPDASFEYAYSENTIKEIVTLRKDVKLSFPVKLSPNTKLIPWDNGQWKIVSTLSDDTMTGIVASKPYGIDAAGNYIDMEYTYSDGSLNLIYNRTISIWLTNKTKGDQILKEFPITYPLIIDPTWTSTSGCWTATFDNQTVIMWNTTGKSTWLVPQSVTSVWYLVIAGGGGGGSMDSYAKGGGGGGAGGLLNGTLAVTPNLNVNVTVGAGGAGGAAGDAHNGIKGGNSSFANTTVGNAINAMGGGYGASSALTGGAGGSGGGGGGDVGAGGANTTGQGWGGGTGYASIDAGGGGGGSGVAGTNAISTAGGKGGNGTASSITGESVTYAGGGGGGLGNPGTPGGNGTGGGGAGGSTPYRAGFNATAYGSGGGGSTSSVSGNPATGGGNGYLGVVIIRYITPPVAIFTSNVTSGTAPTTVQFNDTTVVPTIQWVWNATNVTGNNTPFTFSNIKNATYTFGVGNWSIKLNVSDGVYNTSTQTTFINVSLSTGATLPIVQWTIDKQTVRVPGTVTTVDTSLNTPTSWQWYWGDGSANGTSNQEQHKYVKRGVYQAQLTATNAAGSNTSSKQVRVIGYDQLY
jgi:PKD repeat protein